MKAVAIIGMNYGDEGKGHITNFFCDGNALGIRFNGGAQAAHAVFLSDGRNHIFHQFSAGSLRGARTLLANHFIVNPIFFAEEYAALAKKTKLREIFIDPRCRVTTHFDMLINSFASWYTHKHNTTGVGINETIERSKFRQLRIGMRDLMEWTPDQLKAVLHKIAAEYVPYRIKRLKLPIDKYKAYYYRMLKNPMRTIESYIGTTQFLLQKSVVWPADNLIDRFLAKDPARHLVFEGGQGLLLDQGRKQYMPYLTRSSTGLKNVLETLRTVKTPIELEVYLVTRSYLTRHGDGPLFNEFKLPYEKIKEIANPYNQYQGPMRYGFLKEAWYKDAISELVFNGHKKLPKRLANYKVSVAVTCTDHVDFDLEEFGHVKIISNGPTEKDIKFV